MRGLRNSRSVHVTSDGGFGVAGRRVRAEARRFSKSSSRSTERAGQGAGERNEALVETWEPETSGLSEATAVAYFPARRVIDQTLNARRAAEWSSAACAGRTRARTRTRV